VIRALAVSGGTSGPALARSYLKLAPDVVGFTSNVPILVLHSSAARPTKKADGTRAGTVTIFEPYAKAGRASLTGAPALVARMGVHVHGSSSEGWDKKTYKVELWGGGADDDQAATVLGMGPESDWILFGPFIYDRAMVRNPLMYALGNQLGRWAPATRFAEVYFTDGGRPVAAADYVGVYVVTEKIKADKTRLRIHKLEPTDVDASAVTGGYIFKIDRLNPGEKGIPGGFGPARTWAAPCPAGVRGGCSIGGPNSIGTLSYYYPDEPTILKTPAQVKYLSGALDAFANALAAKQDLSPHIDAPAWIDYHILETFTKNMDAHRWWRARCGTSIARSAAPATTAVPTRPGGTRAT